MAALRVFLSYAHKDDSLRVAFDEHVSVLRNEGLIELWTDHEISGGTEWEVPIRENLERADLILLLVSATFTHSPFVREVELKRALERHQAKQARVVPIIARAVVWQSAPFGKLQALPAAGRAVTSWENPDEAWTDVVKGLRKVVEELLAARGRDDRTEPQRLAAGPEAAGVAGEGPTAALLGSLTSGAGAQVGALVPGDGEARLPHADQAVTHPGICLVVKDIFESLAFYMALGIAKVVMMSGSPKFLAKVVALYPHLDGKLLKEYREDRKDLEGIVFAIGNMELEILHHHPGILDDDAEEPIHGNRISVLACVPSLLPFIRNSTLLDHLLSVERYRWYAVEAWFQDPDGLRIALIHQLDRCDPVAYDKYRKEGDAVLSEVITKDRENRAKRPAGRSYRVRDQAGPGTEAAQPPLDPRQLRRRFS